MFSALLTLPGISSDGPDTDPIAIGYRQIQAPALYATNPGQYFFMRLLFSFVLIAAIMTKSFSTDIDTIDVWTVRLNGKPIVNSNQISIEFGYPMTVDISSLADTDTLEIVYWTDHGSERKKWHYMFRDSGYKFLNRFSNPVDSALRSKKFEFRKNYISFGVGYLKNLFREKKVRRVFVQFEFDSMTEQDSYFGKNICIISN